MLLESQGLNRVLTSIAILLAAGAVLVSCGYNNSSNSGQYAGSGLTFRAFVSNPLAPVGGGGGLPVVNIVDASNDQLSRSQISLISAGPDPGFMALSPSLRFTLVFSSVSNSIVVLDNLLESIAVSGQSALPPITLPGATESMFVALDNATAYAAVPTAPQLSQPPGAVLRLSLGGASVSAQIPIAGAHYIVSSHNGNRILVLSDNSNVVTMIAPSLIGTNSDPLTTVCCFDHPVWGIFSADDSTAYVLNCGPECGGTAAGITAVDLATNTAGVTTPLDSATMALLSGNTLYVAGSRPGSLCGGGTAAVNCGLLSVVDLGSMTVTSTAIITDGYHNRVEMGANGQLFVGARNCTNVNVSGGEVRGCLSIFNIASSSVVVPPSHGDVTGIQPIINRSVVYVVQDGELRIYDTTTDKLQSTQVDIVGQAIDVKLVDR